MPLIDENGRQYFLTELYINPNHLQAIIDKCNELMNLEGSELTCFVNPEEQWVKAMAYKQEEISALQEAVTKIHGGPQSITKIITKKKK